MKIFLDTNVIITGALNPFGPSADLEKITKKVSFIVSNYVLNECFRIIQKFSPNWIITFYTKCAVNNFIKKQMLL